MLQKIHRNLATILLEFHQYKEMNQISSYICIFHHLEVLSNKCLGAESCSKMGQSTIRTEFQLLFINIINININILIEK